MKSPQLCRGCTQPFHPARQGKFCSVKCRDRINNKEKRAYRTANGLCQRCGEPSDGKYNCSTCREWYKVYTKGHGREAHLKRRYGLSEQQFNDLLTQQGGGCKICGTVVSKKSLHVDHDHHTGAIRGILCVRCNMGLGIYESRKADFETYLKGGR